MHSRHSVSRSKGGYPEPRSGKTVESIPTQSGRAKKRSVSSMSLRLAAAIVGATLMVPNLTIAAAVQSLQGIDLMGNSARLVEKQVLK
jgi:hypothetical protein